MDSLLRSWYEASFSHGLKFQGCPRWVPPLPGVLKLNFDSNVAGNPNQASIEKLIRDIRPLELFVFLGSAGQWSANEAEMLALRTGIEEAICLDCSNIIAIGDCYLFMFWSLQKCHDSMLTWWKWW